MFSSTLWFRCISCLIVPGAVNFSSSKRTSLFASADLVVKIHPLIIVLLISIPVSVSIFIGLLDNLSDSNTFLSGEPTREVWPPLRDLELYRHNNKSL
jgi:hypothetical protein